MEDAAIREAFANPRPGADYDKLYDAARCREQVDWIVGINATRLFSCLYHETLNIGRVMTLTLSMVAEREEEIRKFVPEPYHVVRITADGTAFDSRKIKSRDGVRYYIAGDTDAVKELHINCDVALVPIGGTYTMTAKEAAGLINKMKPAAVIPIHYGSIVEKPEDANVFKKLVDPDIQVVIKLN